MMLFLVSLLLFLQKCSTRTYESIPPPNSHTRKHSRLLHTSAMRMGT